MAHLLPWHDLAGDQALLDQERLVAHLAPLERQRLLGEAKPRIGDERDDQRGVGAAGREQLVADRLDPYRLQADDSALAF